MSKMWHYRQGRRAIISQEKIDIFAGKHSGSSLKVMDPEKTPSTLPTTTTECPKCGNNTAFWWMLQTRSADEATTQFFRCKV